MILDWGTGFQSDDALFKEQPFVLRKNTANNALYKGHPKALSSCFVPYRPI